MATKKAPAKKKTTAKTTKTTAKKKTTQVKTPQYETLKLTKKDVPFFGTHLTLQTFYWTLISILVLILGLWIISLQLDVHYLYDQLDAQQTQDMSTPLPSVKN